MRRPRDFIRLVFRAPKIPPSAMQSLSHWITRVSAASRFLAALAIFALVTQVRIAVAAPVYELNERIEVNTLGSWDKAVIIETGKAGGDHEGEFKVHYDGYAASYDRWLRAIYFRKVAPGAAAPAKPAGPAYALNERIEVNTLGSWDKAAIIEVGTAGGEHEGEFKVHYDGYPASYDRWLRAVYFRKVAGGAPAAAAPAGAGTNVPTAPAGSGTTASVAAGAGPRLGKYNINSYGGVGRPPLFLGHIELQAGGKYRISRRSSGEYYGEGAYSFDAATGAVQWLSGPCKDDGWSGTFTIERDGRTHKIRLKSTTIATNSTD
jgi:hypothetical protein